MTTSLSVELSVKQALVIPDCLPIETTEVLTPAGWVKMANWTGQQILISTLDGELRFAVPQAFLVKGTEDLYQFESGTHTLCTTAGHRNLVRWSKPGGPVRTSIRDTRDLLGKHCALPAAGGKIDGRTEDSRFLRLLGMCLGDGTRDTDNWKISVKKPRKAAYLDRLFLEEDMTRNVQGDYVVYRLRAGLTHKVDEWMSSTKVIHWNQWLALDAPGMRAVLEGILEADGTRKRDRANVAFHAVRPEHILLVQTLASCIGYKANLLQPMDNSQSTYPSDKPLLGVCLSRTRTSARVGQYRATAVGIAQVGCFAVETGAFVVRQAGHVWLTGNCHIPHQDERAYALMLKVGRSLNDGRGPSDLYLLGDFADFWAVSAHDKEATAERYLRREVDAVNDKLDQFDRLWPRADKVYIEGNHEDRLTRYLGSKAPELYGLVDCRTLFRMQDRPRWTWVPYGPGQLVRVAKTHLFARHEPLAGGTLPAHGTVAKAGCSVIYGHDHKSQQAQVTTAHGETHLGVSVGWLGDQSKAAFRYVKGLFNWCLGFGVVTYDPATGVFFVDAVRIIKSGRKYHCVANGRWFSVGS